MGGRMSKRKGTRVELEMRNQLRESGLEADRVPLSGAAGGVYSHDLVLGHRRSGFGSIVMSDGEDGLSVEVKSRKDGVGFKTIQGWLDGPDLLVLKSNRHEPFVVMDMELFLKLMRMAG